MDLTVKNLHQGHSSRETKIYLEKGENLTKTPINYTKLYFFTQEIGDEG